jgi:hypothetical protein
MKKWKHLHKIFGILFILTGIILYPTPIPGTTFMVLLGFVWFMGKKKTVDSFKSVLSHKMFNFLKIKKIIEKI